MNLGESILIAIVAGTSFFLGRGSGYMDARDELRNVEPCPHCKGRGVVEKVAAV